MERTYRYHLNPLEVRVKRSGAIGKVSGLLWAIYYLATTIAGRSAQKRLASNTISVISAPSLLPFAGARLSAKQVV